MRRLAVFLVIAGCAHAPKAPQVAVVTPVVDAVAPIAVVEPVCAIEPTVDTIDDGQGVPSPTGSMVLEDVRVLADESHAMVTWMRRSEYEHGDTWRSPYAAQKIGEKWSNVELPVLAYACATYGTIAPNTLERPFVSWGVANSTSFDLWTALPKTTPSAGSIPNYTPPNASVDTPRQDIDHFVASRDVTLGTTTEVDCAVACNCEATRYYGISLRGLDAKHPFTVRLGPLVDDYKERPTAPALAMGPTGGLAAYRFRSKLLLAWLDADGKPLSKGAPLEFASGDVGAPAVALIGNDAIVLWAQRASKTDPYVLQSMRLSYASDPIAPLPIPTGGSAFAPAILADAAGMVVAWMEGDGGTRGEIHVARSLTGPSVIVSGNEKNARDPELSGSSAHTAIVWPSFPENRRAGVIRVGRVTCAK